MNEKFLAELAQFHAYMNEISGLMQEIFTATPAFSVGSDGTGTVEVTIADDGRLEGLTIANHWGQRLDRTEVGGAILDAVRAAEQSRFETVARSAADSGAIDRLEALSINDVEPTRFEPLTPSRLPTVELAQVLSEALRVVDGGNDARTEFTGVFEADDALHTSVTLARDSIVDCTVRLPWGVDLSGDTIAWAVAQAYEAAHGDRLFAGVRNQSNDESSMTNDAIRALVNLQIQAHRSDR